MTDSRGGTRGRLVRFALLAMPGGALASCASLAGEGGEAVVIRGVVSVETPPGFRVRQVTGYGGEGTEFRRYRLGRETGDLCTFRIRRTPLQDRSPDAVAGDLADEELRHAPSRGVLDAARGTERGTDGGPTRHSVTASFSLHSTIYTDYSYWAVAARPNILVVIRQCQSSDGPEAREALTRALKPVFLLIGAEGRAERAPAGA